MESQLLHLEIIHDNAHNVITMPESGYCICHYRICLALFVSKVRNAPR